MLAAALLAAGPTPAEERVAALFPRDAVLGWLPEEVLDDILLEALPPPPNVVVRDTGYYGTVTIDHRAHLARRASCKTCHGPGVVTRLVFTPKIAHGRCIGCHEQQASGPTKCQGCHVKPPEPVVQVAAAPAPPPPPGPNPANVAAALAAFDAAQAGAGGTTGKPGFQRVFDAGLAAGRGAGVSLRLASYQNRIVFTQSMERVSSDAEARTMGLLGAGLSRPLRERVSMEAVALCGFDVVDDPLVALVPAVGARAGLEWRPRSGFLHRFTASITGVVDLVQASSSVHEVGRITVFGTVATGFAMK